MDESTLRLKAREAIRTQKIPNRTPDRMWGGPGSDAACAICGHPVVRDEMGFEVEFARAGEPGDKVSLALHLKCFSAWDLERDDPNRPAAAPSTSSAPAALNGHPLPAASSGTKITHRERDSTHGGGT